MEVKAEQEGGVMANEITICKQCAWLILDRAVGVIGRHDDEPIWYEMLCGALRLPKAINPLTGQEEPYHGDARHAVFIPQEFEYCRDHNDGQCPDFIRGQEGKNQLLTN